MLSDDEQGNGALDNKEGRGAGAGDKKPGEEGKAGRADDGRDGDDAADGEDYGKDADGGQSSKGRGNEEDSKTSGHALATAEAQPAGEHVAEDGEESGDGLRRAQRDVGHEKRAEQAAEPDRGAALEDVEKKRGGGEPFATGAENIGSADVAAADRANVLMSKNADEQVPHGNGSEEVGCGGDNEACEGHDQSEFSR